MMKILRCASVLAVMVAVSGCASAPPAPSLRPKLPNENGYVLSKSALTQQTSHVQRHLDEDKSVVYSQSFGGGGAAVGLLLGPLGVLANIKAIEATTDADMLILKGQVDPRPVLLFTEVAKAMGWPLLEGAAAAGQPQVTPYVLILKTDTDELTIGSVLTIEQGEPVSRWQYFYVLPTRYTVRQLGALSQAEKDELRNGIKKGYGELLAFIDAQSPARLAQEKPASFEAKFLSPMQSFALDGNFIQEADGQVWVRAGAAVWALPKGAIKVSAR